MANPRNNRLRETDQGARPSRWAACSARAWWSSPEVEESVKKLLSPGMLFEELGFRYFGPIDGHDIEKLCDTFSRARA